jgi:hypothetical protein
MRSATRRGFLAGAAAGLAVGPARAADFAYKGWSFDIDRGGGPLPDALLRSLQAQIDIVEAIDIKPDIRAFFRAVPKAIVPHTPLGPGAYDFEKRRMFLDRQIDPPENPVLLHELLHAYHQQRLPEGLKNPRIIAFFEAASLSGRFPAQAYMLTNAAEFFAMCASVVLWGRAARPPSTRAQVRETLPLFYDWIVAQFTPDGAL